MASTNCALFSLGLLVFLQRVTAQSSSAAATTSVENPCPNGFTQHNEKCFMILTASNYQNGQTSCTSQEQGSTSVYYAQDQSEFQDDISTNGLFTGKTSLWYGVRYNAWNLGYYYADGVTPVGSSDYNSPNNTAVWTNGAPNPAGIALSSADNTSVCVQMSANTSAPDGFFFTLTSCDGSGSMICFAEATQGSSTATSPAIVAVFVRTTTVESEADYILNSFKNDARSTFGSTFILLAALFITLTSIKFST